MGIQNERENEVSIPAASGDVTFTKPDSAGSLPSVKSIEAENKSVSARNSPFGFNFDGNSPLGFAASGSAFGGETGFGGGSGFGGSTFGGSTGFGASGDNSNFSSGFGGFNF